MIEAARIKVLKDGPEREDASFVLYWMGLSQRAAFNPALEYAVREANDRKLPVLVCYGLAEGFPEVNARHWTFLLQGLADVGPALARRGIGFVARREPPVETALRYAEDAALVVLDRNYLAPIKRFYADFVERAPGRVIQIEGDVVVPVETASPKHEYAARTLRPKLGRISEGYLVALEPEPVNHRAPPRDGETNLDLGNIPKLVASLRCDQTVGPVRRFKGGAEAAQSRLTHYLEGPFAHYAGSRGKPEAGSASHMSPYLHYGQISPVDIALRIRNAPQGDADDRAAYLEELIVRRELAINHISFQPNYSDYACLPEWARKTLHEHCKDKRPFLYTAEQFERGETHDRYWNAAMLEMRATGYMHNHMRMYWGKKILEWSATPEEAWDTTLRLNNRFFIDGRDPSSFTNVAWLFGLHDRPWGPRPVFGTVRSMGQNTFKKFDAEAYVAQVERLAAAEEEAG